MPRYVRLAALLALPALAHAEPLVFQQTGRLLDSTGSAINGTHTLAVRLYDASGGEVWARAFPTTFEQGYYAVVLGTDDTGRTLEAATSGPNPAVELGLTVDALPELPRTPFGAVPRAATTDAVRTGTAVAGPCPGDGAVRFDTGTDRLVVCVNGAWLPVLVDPTATSCAEVLLRDPSATSGPYEIDPDGVLGPNDPYTVECDMTTDSGGWTKVATHVGGTANSWFWNNPAWFAGARTTTGSPSSNTADHVSYAAFDLPANEVLVKRSTGTPVQRAMDANHQDKPITHWMSQVGGTSTLEVGTDIWFSRVYGSPVMLGVNTSPAESAAFFGVTWGSEHIGALRLFAYDRSTASDPWHMWHGVQASIDGVDGGDGCAQLPSPWARRALHPNGVTDVCYATTTADAMTVWIR